MNTLSGILNECGLVCPYDDELVCQLEEICHDFVESVDLKESEFADWVQCYCRGNYSSKVRTFVEKINQYGRNTDPTALHASAKDYGRILTSADGGSFPVI